MENAYIRTFKMGNTVVIYRPMYQPCNFTILCLLFTGSYGSIHNKIPHFLEIMLHPQFHTLDTHSL